MPEQTPDAAQIWQQAYAAERVLEAAAQAETRSAHWLALGNAASERGETALAERHYARSQRHLDRANQIRKW
jgi:hypothetical protein